MSRTLQYQVEALLADIDDEGGEMATGCVLTFHEQKVLDQAGKLGYVGYRMYANGEHVCLTDAGNEAHDKALVAFHLEQEEIASGKKALRDRLAAISLSLRINIPMPDYEYGNVQLESRLWQYNPDYGDDKVCKCGHKYYRHFDTYEEMYPIGCKYCACDKFEPVN